MNLPDNVSEADFDRAFPPDCPGECSGKQVYSECGGEDECVCYPDTLRGRFLRIMDLIKFGEEVCVPREKECDCPSDDDIAAERDEAMADARSER